MQDDTNERTFLFREIIHDSDEPTKIRGVQRGVQFADIAVREQLPGEYRDDFYRVENEDLPIHYSLRVYYYEANKVVDAFEVYLEQDITEYPDQSVFDDTVAQLTEFYTSHFGAPEEIVESDPDYGEYYERTWNVPDAPSELYVTVMTYFADREETMNKVLKVIVST